MAVSNQVVSLQIQVTETGAVKVSTIAQDLGTLGKSAIDSSTGMLKLNDIGQAATNIFQGLGQEGANLLGRFSGLLGVLGPVGLGIGAMVYAATEATDKYIQFATQVRDLSYLAGASAQSTSIPQRPS